MGTITLASFPYRGKQAKNIHKKFWDECMMLRVCFSGM
jgi:hypothetical protein